MTTFCHCGKPLHYTDKEIENHITNLVEKKGRFIAITNIETMKRYLVDRHFIALHGIYGKDLDKYGFKELKN